MREKHYFRLEIYDRLRTNEQAAYKRWAGRRKKKIDLRAVLSKMTRSTREDMFNAKKVRGYLMVGYTYTYTTRSPIDDPESYVDRKKDIITYKCLVSRVQKRVTCIVQMLIYVRIA